MHASLEPAVSPASFDGKSETRDRAAVDALFEGLYRELHRLSRILLCRVGSPMPLGATTLLHEVYLDIGSGAPTVFPDRARFMAYAARAMRGIIVDRARHGQAQKRGGRFHITSLGSQVIDNHAEEPELVRVNEAVEELAEVDPQLAELVELRFFCGLSFAEIAALRGTVERTVQRHWQKARIFLHRRVREMSA